MAAKALFQTLTAVPTNDNNHNHYNNNSKANGVTDQTRSTIPVEAYNAIKNIFEQPQFENFVSTYMSNVFLPEEQPSVEAQEFSMEELSFEQEETSVGTYGTLELSSCVSCDVQFKVNFEEFPSSYTPYEESFNYEQSSLFPITAAFSSKLSFQQKDIPLHRSLPELPLTSSDGLAANSPSPSPSPSFSYSPLFSPDRTPSPTPRHYQAARSSSLPTFETSTSPCYYFSAPSSTTNSPTKPQKAPAPYSTLPNTDIRLERTPLRKVIWTPLLHERFLSALDSLDPSGEGIAKPRDIVEKMGVPGLTRANISSHLQKYKLKNKPKHSITQRRK